MRIVADTAILVRANAKAIGPARELIAKIQQRGDILLLSQFLLEEVGRVLRYPRMRSLYDLGEPAIQRHLNYLQTFAEIVAAAEGPRIVPDDPQDDPVVYTAIAGGADVLCTLDRHFYAPSVLAFCSRHGVRVMDDLTLLRTLREVT